MHAKLDPQGSASSVLSHSLSSEWEELCARYLPLGCRDSIWRYSRGPARSDPEQGWKLHVSATIMTANEVLKKVAPHLCKHGIRFKAPSSLCELQKLNSGLCYGYSQVGKFITVYTRSAEEAASLARRLHWLTRRMCAPLVPFDLRFRRDSCIYYRYGSFKHLEIENEDGTRTPAIRAPEGRLVPDARESWTARPAWVSDLFVRREPERKVAIVESPLVKTFRAFQALAQRGKGGVYKALDLRERPPRLCVLKEGRAGGELAWDGRDGHWRVRHEERVLSSLRAAGVNVPRVYSSFEVEGNYYLVMEFIDGETLQNLLYKRQRRLPLSRALLYGARLSCLISQIHAAGWVWRDCKPANVVVAKEGSFRPLDFEGACLIGRPERARWSTTGFAPPLPRDESEVLSSTCDDLYALGAVVYLLLTGRLPETTTTAPLEKLRRNVPARVREMVIELLSADSRRQPNARTVMEELTAALSTFGERRKFDSEGAAKNITLRGRHTRRELEPTREVGESHVRAEAIVDRIVGQENEA
jgi:hypothetical protein